VRVLSDTNILIRLSDAGDPRHLECVQALQRLRADGHEICIYAQVQIEYWAVATRPRAVNGLDLSPGEAEADLVDFDTLFVLLLEPSDIAISWRALANRYAVSGRQAHDTRPVALMLAHRITHLLTLNPGDFRRYTEITCLGLEDV
jgi:predicted nucleic acid-binding protein